MSKNRTRSNLQLAGIFVVLVAGLILLSLLLKVFFLFRESKFDGQHNFIVGFVSQNKTKLVSFSPGSKAIAVLNINVGLDRQELSKYLEVPVDGTIELGKQNVEDQDLATVLFSSIMPFSNRLDGLTPIDCLRLSIFTKTVKAASVYDRDFSDNLNGSQKATTLALSFTDPTVYQENLGIQIVNGTGISGAGGRLAALITNIGGNPILVGTAETSEKQSKIIYYLNNSYTVQKLSDYLGFPTEESDKKGIGDVIIIIGEDKANNLNF